MFKAIVFALLLAAAIIGAAADPGLAQDRSLKNTLGDTKGFGRCPNCGDSWSWKPVGHLWFKENRGVTICKECLARPEKLNEYRIEKHLCDNFWLPAEAAKVREAVKKYKIKHGINYL